eukprot:TRINITY_DN16472_c0_g1_i1.p1 TRINITY_DN16472_c0_g1~~TRINITY_DN16472_c0_g1_i1.p1  ORF type:complete len:1030 (+),score=278.70 TRINITY_DN16472_c0_g1_i1:441-3092(+)
MAEYARQNSYVLRKVECRILSEASLRSPSVPTGFSRIPSKRVYPNPNELAKNEFYDFATMTTYELERLTDAVVNIQKIFRGHRARLSFKMLRPAQLSAWIERAMENERLQKRVHQVESIFSGLDETLLAMGVEHDQIASLKSVAASVRAKYQHTIDDVRNKREAARERLNKVKQFVQDSSGEEEGPFWRRAAARVTNTLLSIVGLLRDTDMEEMDSQQTAWQTEAVFKAIVEGDVGRLKHVVSEDQTTMHARDHFGATPLLVCALLNTPVSKQMIRWLLSRNGKLAQDVYTTDFFKGELALHFTIVNRDLDMTRLLLDHYPDALLQPARGLFFKDRVGGCYFGEWPLMFAISTNQPDMVQYLLMFASTRLRKKRSEMLDVRDTDGNTVLHMCVWHNLPHMYEFLEQLCKEEMPSFYECGLTSCYNTDGLTPFTLAAERGHMEMFSYLLESNTQVTWNYGPHSLRAVFIDEIEPSGISDGKPGILQLLVDNNHLKLLALPLIRNFLHQKWNSYVKRVFIKRIAMVVFYVIAFMVAGFKERSPPTGCFTEHIWGDQEHTPGVFLQSATNFSRLDSFVRCESNTFFTFHGWWNLTERVADFIVLSGAIWKGSRELGEMSEGGLNGYFGVKGSMLLENVLSSSCCLFTLLSYVCRAFKSDIENLCGALAALLLWSYILWLMLGFKQTGPFIIMIWKMLMDDMIQFLAIFLTFQLGFTQAFYLVLDTDSEGKGDDGYLFVAHMRKSFEVLLGEVSLDITSEMTSYPLIAYLLMVIYVILVTILLLNLLIAMMSTTYSEIQEEADTIWNMEFSRMILSLESELTPKEKQKFKWWSIVEGRRCFMLPMLTEEGKKRYWGDYKPNWDLDLRKHFPGLDNSTYLRPWRPPAD